VNILYVCADWGIPIRGYKGASVHVREFVNALHQQGHDVTLMFATGGEGNPDPHARLIEVAPDPTPATRSREAVGRGIALDTLDKPLCRELDKLAYSADFAERAQCGLRVLGVVPDVVFERYALFQDAGPALARALDVPYVLEVNAPLLEEQERHRGLRLKAAARAAESACFQSATHILAVSDALKRYIEAAGIATNRVSCLPNGVDTRRFTPAIDPQPIRARYALGQRPVIGFVGSLKPWHGMDFLFDGMRALSLRHDACRLLLVGDGPGFNDAVARTREEGLAGRVVLAGNVPHQEIPAYLAAMDLTVAPYSEGGDFYFSPLKVLESLAAGRPVVAPRMGQLNDLIRDGITGLLYPPGDLQAFVDHVDRLLSDTTRRRAMGDHARDDAVARLSWERVVGQAVSIIGQARQAA
jgi:glycosyltransferase involved in cell wall biosynthesis